MLPFQPPSVINKSCKETWQKDIFLRTKHWAKVSLGEVKFTFATQLPILRVVCEIVGAVELVVQQVPDFRIVSVGHRVPMILPGVLLGAERRHIAGVCTLGEILVHKVGV